MILSVSSSYAADSQGKNFVLIGPPASGKGTLASFLNQTYSIPSISSGDLLRAQIHEKTPLGLQLEQVMKKGDLVDDRIVVNLIKERLTKTDAQHGYILDGFPRTVAQAELMALAHIDINYVIILEISKEEVLKRSSARMIHPPSGRIYDNGLYAPKVAGKDDITGEPLVQRADDNQSSMLHRLEVYELQTVPVIQWYDRNHNVYNYKIIKINVEGKSAKEIQDIITNQIPKC